MTTIRPTRAPFGTRLTAALDAHGPLCVGIDVHPELLTAWGLPRDLDGLIRFADACVSAFAGQVALVKPQSAFFEAFGAAGIAVLERTTAALRSAGTAVLLDVKRGDIGSTMAAYAHAYLDPASPGAGDAITANPYLGVGALQPAFDAARRYGGGVFVLARTSNPEGAAVQLARPAGSGGPNGSPATVAAAVVAEVAARNAEVAPQKGAPAMGSFGVVVGATAADRLDLTGLAGPVLMPGIGVQGGAPADVARLGAQVGRWVVPSVSREILGAGPSPADLRNEAQRLAERFGFLR